MVLFFLFLKRIYAPYSDPSAPGRCIYVDNLRFICREDIVFWKCRGPLLIGQYHLTLTSTLTFKLISTETAEQTSGLAPTPETAFRSVVMPRGATLT